MPPTLLPRLDLSPTLEFVKVEITCTARPVERPTKPSQNSITSSSESTYTPTSSRRTRPILSPEALLIHAFGPTELSKLAPSANEGQPSSPSASNSTCSSSSESVMSRRRRRREMFCEIRNSLPAAPPPGTFRSAAKPVKAPSIRLPLSEPNPFRVNHDDCLGEQGSSVESRECERFSEREPPMSRLQWREKTGDRLQRRKLLRRKNDAQGADKLPLDIDCRPMAGSMNLPPTNVVPKTRKQKIQERILSLPAVSVGMPKDVTEEPEQVSPKETALINEASRSESTPKI